MNTVLATMLAGFVIGLIVGFPITIIVYNQWRERKQKAESRKAFKDVV